MLARRPTHATIVSYLALFAALGLGTAWAATELGKNDVTSKHIKNGNVKGKDLADGAVSSPKVADGSLLAEDFAAGSLPAGEKGDTGAQGVQGPPGPTSSAFVSADPADTSLAPPNAFVPKLFTSITTTTSSRVIGDASIQVKWAFGGDATAECRISVDGTVVGVPVLVSLPINSGPDVLSLSAGAVVPAGTHDVRVECSSGATNVEFHRGNLTVIAAGA